MQKQVLSLGELVENQQHKMKNMQKVIKDLLEESKQPEKTEP